MNALARIAEDMRNAERTGGDRAYHALCRVATEGGEITLSDHELVQAISRALWQRQLFTAQLGLTELEIRTSADAVRQHERRAA